MGADLRAATILVRVNTPRISRRHVKVRSFLYHRWILDKSERLVRADLKFRERTLPRGINQDRARLTRLEQRLATPLGEPDSLTETPMARVFDRYSRREVLRAIGAASLLGGVAWGDEPEKTVPEQIVDAMNALFGKHPGFRSAHAKGIVCEGEFTPAASAATLSKAPHLQGKPVRVTIRFSDSTGLPDIPDGVPDAGPRGMAVRFHLPNGGSTDIVANAFNGFAVATGEDFLAFLKAVASSGKDAPKPTPRSEERRV